MNGIKGYFCRSRFFFRYFFGPAAILLLSLFSCSQGRESIPLGEDELVNVLIDVHIAEAAVQTLRGATKDSMINLYYDQICEIHGVNREEFETSMEILRNDPKRLEELYAEVMSEMERQEVEGQDED